MQISRCTKSDYDQIVSPVEEFWGSDCTLSLHHPIFIHEFGNTAFAIKNWTEVAAYLWGFLSQVQPTAYVHLLAVRVPYRRQGLARQLYNHFCTYARAQDCTQCRAITTSTNKESIAFHRALGFELTGKPNRDGIPVVEDYSGPGQD
jgi:ribosomal protein S18 acetylase RimI-like enzyme